MVIQNLICADSFPLTVKATWMVMVTLIEMMSTLFLNIVTSRRSPLAIDETSTAMVKLTYWMPARWLRPAIQATANYRHSELERELHTQVRCEHAVPLPGRAKAIFIDELSKAGKMNGSIVRSNDRKDQSAYARYDLS